VGTATVPRTQDQHFHCLGFRWVSKKQPNQVDQSEFRIKTKDPLQQHHG